MVGEGSERGRGVLRVVHAAGPFRSCTLEEGTYGTRHRVWTKCRVVAGLNCCGRRYLCFSAFLLSPSVFNARTRPHSKPSHGRVGYSTGNHRGEHAEVAENNLRLILHSPLPSGRACPRALLRRRRPAQSIASLASMASAASLSTAGGDPAGGGTTGVAAASDAKAAEDGTPLPAPVTVCHSRNIASL